MWTAALLVPQPGKKIPPGCISLGYTAGKAASCFAAGPMAVNAIGDSIGQASALKMCYAAYTKGTSALLCAILAAAEALNVRQELVSEWSMSGI